jgi:predicted site-specific integrase-resolvase
MDIKLLEPRKRVLEVLKIHYQTLNQMSKRGDIEFVKINERRKMYNLDKYLKDHNLKTKTNTKRICYCRVSSAKQKNDLERQVQQMIEAFPSYEIIKDIGSGLNFERKGLQKVIDLAIKGELEVLVIGYKDRLARIGYEMLENIIKRYSNGSILVLNKKEEETPEEEMTKDVMSIMNIYVAKINGLRKYKKVIKDEIKKKK